MPKDWTITKVLGSGKPWKNGISYYEVLLEGHPRPVSVGKKSVPQEGWTVYGDIEETPSGLADKFTSASKPFDGQAPFVSAPQAVEPRYTGQTGADSSRASIERQVALKTAVEFINGQAEYNEDKDRQKAVLEIAENFDKFLAKGRQ